MDRLRALSRWGSALKSGILVAARGGSQTVITWPVVVLGAFAVTAVVAVVGGVKTVVRHGYAFALQMSKAGIDLTITPPQLRQ